MNEYVRAARRLHQFLMERYWTGERLVGPDLGVKLDYRYLRFVKSYLALLPWRDDRYFLQAQAYWVLVNWQLFDFLGDQAMADVSARCSWGILKSQRAEGYWDYPHPGWEGRIATVETVWAAMGMLATYERTGDRALLEGVLRAYRFLVEHTGFQQVGPGKAINYFANQPRGAVPNNNTFALMLFGRLSHVTGDDRYLVHCPDLISFLNYVQLPTGEFPYEVETPLGKGRVHYQCYQYHAFELQDLAMYYDATRHEVVLPIIAQIARFLTPSVNEDGSTRFECGKGHVERVYNTAAVASALGLARRLGLHDEKCAEDRAFAYVLSQQENTGGFPFSRQEYRWFKDRRYYMRPLAMVLYHLLLKGLPTTLTATEKDKPVSEYAGS